MHELRHPLSVTGRSGGVGGAVAAGELGQPPANQRWAGGDAARRAARRMVHLAAEMSLDKCVVFFWPGSGPNMCLRGGQTESVTVIAACARQEVAPRSGANSNGLELILPPCAPPLQAIRHTFNQHVSNKLTHTDSDTTPSQPARPCPLNTAAPQPADSPVSDARLGLESPYKPFAPLHGPHRAGPGSRPTSAAAACGSAAAGAVAGHRPAPRRFPAAATPLS